MRVGRKEEREERSSPLSGLLTRSFRFFFMLGMFSSLITGYRLHLSIAFLLFSGVVFRVVFVLGLSVLFLFVRRLLVRAYHPVPRRVKVMGVTT